MTTVISRPAETEYSAFYAGYVQRVPDGNIFDTLRTQIGQFNQLLSTLSAEQASFRPGPKEWSIKEVIGHINDGERIFAYRALRISRGDQLALPGFNQDLYVAEANFDGRTLPDLLEEFELLRRANILQFAQISETISVRMGTVNNAPISVRALLYIMAGHVAHHIASLQTDYLPKMA